MRLCYALLSLLDKLLELGSFPLLWVELALETFIDSLILHVLLIVALPLVRYIVDELEGVQ